ncbi:Arylsulfatase [Mariniblastus fucicola]|uniref:Arylsulfatase n=2 Tax=Mariniblastus fucicola TaxID=980251 RepID=A0A5B9P8C4_9BACT|nr:Arylsulfatase [Mariniblastus fucicola]
MVAVTCGSSNEALGPSRTLDVQKPNVVLILCDDLGIGDVQCFNPENGKIKTPFIDQLAKEGMSFTDAHSGSSVCTPTRYGLLTGRYAWRTKLQNGVAQGFEDCLIAPDRPTIGNFLGDNGYRTALLGKWHLNMKFTDPQNPGIELVGKKFKYTPPVNSTSPDGPISRGFDVFFGIHHARSMKAIIEQDTVVRHEDVISFLPTLESKAVEFINQQAESDQPFFLFLPLGSPHTPIVPTKAWQGASGLGAYADFVMQTDHVIGTVLKQLDARGFRDNTIVIFSSDNGCSRQAKIGQLAKQGHSVSAGFRGSKSDIWDGGHRVPLVIRWPGVVEDDSRCGELVGLTDIFATVADCLSLKPPAKSCEDSVSFLAAMMGEEFESKRDGIVHHAINGHFAYRTPEWKLVLARGSGGWSGPNENNSKDQPEAQLYDMRSDQDESRNVYESRPDIAARLLAMLERDVANGRTTPGPFSPNDTDEIQLWKSGRDQEE